jgi:hypothetical protein
MQLKAQRWAFSLTKAAFFLLAEQNGLWKKNISFRLVSSKTGH